MGHGRAPCVKHPDHAELGAEPLRIGSDREQRLGTGLEQQVVDHRFVLESDRADARRQREHDVVVGQRQKLGLAVFKPLPGCCSLMWWTVPASGLESFLR